MLDQICKEKTDFRKKIFFNLVFENVHKNGQINHCAGGVFGTRTAGGIRSASPTGAGMSIFSWNYKYNLADLITWTVRTLRLGIVVAKISPLSPKMGKGNPFPIGVARWVKER